jgi:hypothetical protein
MHTIIATTVKFTSQKTRRFAGSFKDLFTYSEKKAVGHALS